MLKSVEASKELVVHRAKKHVVRDCVRGGAEGALAPPEFEGSERRTEGETDNPLLIAPSESKS